MDIGLIRLIVLRGKTAKPGEDARGDANGDQLFGVASGRAAHTAGATKLGGRGFRDVGEIEPAIRQMLPVPCESPGAR